MLVCFCVILRYCNAGDEDENRLSCPKIQKWNDIEQRRMSSRLYTVMTDFIISTVIIHFDVILNRQISSCSAMCPIANTNQMKPTNELIGHHRSILKIV